MSASAQPARLTYVGHATVRFELDGVRVITDPVFRRRLLHLRRHGSDPRDEARAAVDVILISHLHLDHADLRSLGELGTDVPIIVPDGAGDFLRGKGHTRVSELATDESAEIAGLRFTATRAEHDGRRTPLVGHRASSAGFEITGSQRVYFAGDTDLFAEMEALAGGLDVALLPVWGWGTTLGEGHLDPRDAAEAVGLLRPRVAVPIHWGTFFPFGLHRRHGHLLADPPREFARRASELVPDVEVRVLEPGESTEVAAPEAPP